MADLFTILSSTSHSLDAHRFGLDIVGQNLANVNTTGYTRRSVVIEDVPPLDPTSAGGGARVQEVVAARTPMLDMRMFREQPAAGRESAVADQLALVESLVGAPGAGLDADLTRFYDAFADLAGGPTSTVNRQLTAREGEALAQAFHTMAAGLTRLRQSADLEARTVVERINTLAAAIAALNGQIAQATGGARDALLDRQAVALKDLSDLVDIGIIPREDGGVDLTIANGHALVAGERSYALSVASTPPLGLADIVSHSTTVTGEITGGRLGGLLVARDVRLTGYADRLDALAYRVVSEVNALHTAGYDLNGNPGVAFFQPLASAAGAAAAMAMNAAVVADPALVAAAGSSAAGDNQNARAIAALREGPQSALDDWSVFAFRVGADRESALADLAVQRDILQQIESMRASIAGVSIDEEAAMMMRFQRAYEANARFFSVIDQLLDVLLAKVG